MYTVIASLIVVHRLLHDLLSRTRLCHETKFQARRRLTPGASKLQSEHRLFNGAEPSLVDCVECVSVTLMPVLLKTLRFRWKYSMIIRACDIYPPGSNEQPVARW